MYLTVTCVAIAVPWLHSIRNSPQRTQSILSLLLLIHSLHCLHNLVLRPPPNIFSALRIPINTPTDSIRALLLRKHHLDPELESLLKRLASFDTRTLYPRFGHNVVATCAYCQSFDDFALYALPRPLLAYIREMAFIGLITFSSSTAPLRKPAVAGLVLMGIAEAYTLITVSITIPLRGSDTKIIMWHDSLIAARHIIFLLLPILVHFLPRILLRYNLRIPFLYTPSTGSNSTALLAQTHQTLTHLLPALHLLKYAHTASMRVPALRTRVGAWWAEERRVGSWILDDGKDGGSTNSPSVRSVARGLGIGFDEGGREEGKLKINARAAVGGLMVDGLKPSQHWPVQQGP